MPLLGIASIVLLLIETAVPAYCFALTVVLRSLFLGPFLPVLLLLSLLCFFSIVGVVLCAVGIILRSSLFKWLLISLSVLGVIPLPVSLLYGVADSETLVLLSVVAGWSALTLLTTLVAFSYIDRMQRKEQVKASSE
jgi:hypothetical protein